MGVRQVTAYICDLTGVESDNINDFTVVVIGTPTGNPREFIVHDDAIREELEDGDSVFARLYFKEDDDEDDSSDKAAV